MKRRWTRSILQPKNKPRYGTNSRRNRNTPIGTPILGSSAARAERCVPLSECVSIITHSRKHRVQKGRICARRQYRTGSLSSGGTSGQGTLHLYAGRERERSPVSPSRRRWRVRAAHSRQVVSLPPPLGIVALRAGKCVATGDDGKRYCDDPLPTRRGLADPEKA